MSQIGDYVIWVGDKLQEQMPSMSWDAIMDVVVSGNFDQERYSIKAYLNDRYANKSRKMAELGEYLVKGFQEGLKDGESQQASGKSGSDEHVSGESEMAGESEPHARQPGFRDMEEQFGEKTLDPGRYPFVEGGEGCWIPSDNNI